MEEQTNGDSPYIMKCNAAGWYLIRLYAYLPDFRNRKNEEIADPQTKILFAALIVAFLAIINIIYTLIPYQNPSINNIVRGLLLLSLPIFIVWSIYQNRRKNKKTEEYTEPPYPEETNVFYGEITENEIIINKYNKKGYEEALPIKNIVSAQIIPTQIYFETTKRRIGDWNKKLAELMETRFQEVEEEFPNYPYTRQILRNDQLSIKLESKNGHINIVPIPPDLLENKETVENMLLYLDEKMGYRFYMEQEDEEFMRDFFPRLYYAAKNTARTDRINAEQESNRIAESPKQAIKRVFRSNKKSEKKHKNE